MPWAVPGRHRPAPAALLGDLVEHRADPVVAQVRAAELVGVLPHRRRELVDDELAGDADVGRVDVAHAAGVEPLVGLDERLGDQRRSRRAPPGSARRSSRRTRGCPAPAGRSAAMALMISPSPCRKSVSTLVWRLLEREHLAAGVRWPGPGWSPSGAPRPTRASSARCHISLTGLPIAWEILAASSAPSKNSRRPNEPPPVHHVDRDLVRRHARASRRSAAWAMIGDFSPAQMVARSARTSATAELVSIAELLRK